jgi:hypothetical protein
MIKATLVLVLGLILALTLTTTVSIQIAQCQDGGQGGSVDVPPPSPSIDSSGGGSSHRQIDFDKILKAVQEGKQKKPDKFEELKKLLYIEPFSTVPYSTELSLALGISGNKTLARNDRFTVTATIVNPNPIEIRRALYIHLEALSPGDNSFKIMNPVAQIIQINEYEESGNGKNVTARAFPDLTSFSHLNEVGPAVLRLSVSDGQYNWISQNLTLNVTNQPPRLENLSIWPKSKTRYNDAILYLANVTDPDGDEVNVTLYVIDDHGMERGNITQMVAGEGQASFLGNEFFSKSDAGKNFTYYYTFGDGVISNATAIQAGPNLRKSVSIHVEKPWVTPEDENQYWWQNYNFTLGMKNQDPEEAKVQVTLFTDTSAHPWRAVASKEVTLTQEPQVVYFNIQPFDVLDANQSIRFKFAYSEYDQNQQDQITKEWEKAVNAKLVRYETVSWVGIGNVLAIFLIAFLISILVERGFYR